MIRQSNLSEQDTAYIFDLYNRGSLSIKAILDLFDIEIKCPVCGVEDLELSTHFELMKNDPGHLIYSIINL